MILRWRCLIESESGAMGPASIVNDLQPEQTEKSGLHNLTLKAYSPGYARYTPKQLINLPLIPPTRANPRQRRRQERMEDGSRAQIICRLYKSRQICLAEPLRLELPCRRLPICIPLHTLCNRKAAPKRCQVTHRIKLDCVFSCSPAFNGLISLLNILHGARRVGII